MEALGVLYRMQRHGIMVALQAGNESIAGYVEGIEVDPGSKQDYLHVRVKIPVARAEGSDRG